MSKFTLKIVTPTYTHISSIDSAEVFEHMSPPFMHVYEGRNPAKEIILDYICTAYIENANGKTVKMVHGVSGPQHSPTTKDSSSK